MRWTSILVSLAFVLVTTGSALADHHNEAAPSHDEMMAEWMKINQPSDMHKKLEMFVGSWTVTTKMWMEGPGKDPMVSKGKSTAKFDFDGRFLVENMDSQMMGAPYKGLNILGYDNFRKQFVGTWVDSMNTGLSSYTAVLSRDGKTMTAHMRMDEPMTGEIGKLVRMVTVIKSKDEYVQSMYDPAFSDTEPVMEMHYKRVK